MIRKFIRKFIWKFNMTKYTMCKLKRGFSLSTYIYILKNYIHSMKKNPYESTRNRQKNGIHGRKKYKWQKKCKRTLNLTNFKENASWNNDDMLSLINGQELKGGYYDVAWARASHPWLCQERGAQGLRYFSLRSWGDEEVPEVRRAPSKLHRNAKASCLHEGVAEILSLHMHVNWGWSPGRTGLGFEKIRHTSAASLEDNLKQSWPSYHTFHSGKESTL